MPIGSGGVGQTGPPGPPGHQAPASPGAAQPLSSPAQPHCHGCGAEAPRAPSPPTPQGHVRAATGCWRRGKGPHRGTPHPPHSAEPMGAAPDPAASSRIALEPCGWVFPKEARGRGGPSASPPGPGDTCWGDAFPLLSPCPGDGGPESMAGASVPIMSPLCPLGWGDGDQSRLGGRGPAQPPAHREPPAHPG